MGDLTKNFSRSEFKCRHCGRLDVLDMELVWALQRLRDKVGRALPIISGYRCCAGNAQVGGTYDSQHLFGRAADIPAGYATAAQCRAAGLRGIGLRRGKVVHVDMTTERNDPREYVKSFTFIDG
jgi:uncharacterized protein YcbK (DUF882 family)